MCKNPKTRSRVTDSLHSDVLVVGTGNAAFCAALSAQQQGAQVRMLEVAPEAEFGGNSRYTAGAMRFAYDHGEQLLPLLADPDDERLPRTNFGQYSQARFLDDLREFNGAQTITPHQQMLVAESYSLMQWLRETGVSFAPIYSRQSFEQDGRYQFWGGLTLCADGEGEGLVQRQRELFLEAGGHIHYSCEARQLITHDAPAGVVVEGVRAQCKDKQTEFFARSTVLACGGFEANEELRVHHLGADWRHAKVRGSRHNQGHGLAMATAVGAALAGKFDGCHATPMDRHMPNYGNPQMPHLERKNYRKISYPFGVMLNARGKRFVDEGVNFRNYTYAQYGRAILEQPGHFAWQIFDAQVLELLYEEYRVDFASKVQADSLEQLVAQLDGVDGDAALATLKSYNAAVDRSTPFDPTIKDGRTTRGLAPEKTNWANPLTKPPFVAYPVTCGITFSYGGLKVSLAGEVLNNAEEPIDGLFACGELVGDLFFEGYPGGSGLTSGGVFGRAAGRTAANQKP